MKKRILCFLLFIVMCLSLIPTAFAAETPKDLQVQYHSDDQTITWDAFPNAVSYSFGIRNPGSSVNLFTVRSEDEEIDIEEILSTYLTTYGMITHTTDPGTNAGFYVNSLTNDYGIKGSYDICVTVTYKAKDAFGNVAQKTEDTTVTRVRLDYVLKNGYPGAVDGIRIVRNSSNHPVLTWEDNRREGGVKKRCSYKVTVSFVSEGNTYYYNGSGVTVSEYTIMLDSNTVDLVYLENELSARGMQNSRLTVKVEAELADIYYYKYVTSSTADVYFNSTAKNPYSVVYWSDETANRFSATYDLNGMDHSPDFSKYTYKISLMKTISATNRTAVYTVNATSSEVKKTLDLSNKVAGNGSAQYSVLVQEIYKSGSLAGEEHAAYETWKRRFDVSAAKPLANPTPDLDPNGKLKWQSVPHATGYHVILRDNKSNTLAELDTKETKYDFSSYMTNNGVYRCYVTAFDTTGAYAKSDESRTEWTTYTVYKFLGIYVCGIPITEANRYDVLGDGSVKFLPNGLSYYDYLRSETLVLNNVHFDKSRYHRDGAGNKAVIYIDNDISVYLIGDNVIDVDWEEDLDGIYLAPYDFINFYSDSGSLTVNVSRNGGRAIAAPGSCVSLWENATLDLTGHYGFYSDAAGDIGYLELWDNAKVYAHGLRTDDDKEGNAVCTCFCWVCDNAYLYCEYEWNQPAFASWGEDFHYDTPVQVRGIRTSAFRTDNWQVLNNFNKGSCNPYEGDYYILEAKAGTYPDSKKHTVTFNMNGHGTAPIAQTVEEGNKATKPSNPTASGYVFGGWYTDSTLKTVFDFAKPIDKDTVIFAKWTKSSTGVKVSGTLTSFGESTTTSTLILTKSGQSTPTYTTSVTGDSVSYSFADVEAGTYTLTVSKSGHTTREYTVVVGSSDFIQNVEINLRGDVTNDGVVNSRDLSRLYAHVSKDNLLTGYALKCGEATDDDAVNSRDLSRLYAHVSKTLLLFDE